MILVTIKAFGMTWKTFHIPVGIDLPTAHWTLKVSFISIDFTLGPKEAIVPAHSEKAVKVEPHEVSHDEPHPALGSWS